MTGIVTTGRLFNLADEAGIVVEFHPFAEPLLGYYFAETPLPPTVGLRSDLPANERLMRCVLAEELGHHFTSASEHVAMPYRTYLGRVLLCRAEKRALAWAGQALMPELEVVGELRQGAGVEDLAEDFGVTPAFVRAVMLLPGRTGLLKRRRAADEVLQA